MSKDRSFKDLPEIKPIKGKFTFKKVVGSTSYVLKNKIIDNRQQVFTLELVLSLSNKIIELENRIENLEKG